MITKQNGLKISDIEKILNDTPGHIYWKDREGRYLGCNLRQAQSCGYDTIEAFLGKNDFDLLSHEEAEIIRANDLEVMASNAPWTKEEIVELKGKIHSFLSHKMPLKNDDGDVIGIVGMSFDITDQKYFINSLSSASQQELQKKRYKVTLQNIPKEDGDYLKSKSCILLISIENHYQEGEKFRAILQNINASLRTCTIIIGDTLNRHYLHSNYPSKTLAELYNVAEKAGDDWLLKHQSMIEEELQIPYKIIRWREFLNHPKFLQKLSEVKNLFASNDEYKLAVNNSIDDFLNRKDSKIDIKIAYNDALEYLLEECAIMLIWFDEPHHYQIYPTKRLEAVDLTFQLLATEQSTRWQLPIKIKIEASLSNGAKMVNDSFAFEQIIANLPGHIYWKNKHGMILGCNFRQAINLGARNIHELMYKSDFDLYNYQIASKVRDNDLAVMKSGKLLITEESVEIEGKKHIFLSHKTPLKNSHSEPIGILGVSLDITRQKELEEELIEKNHQLEEALNAKSIFMNNMSHEIRTPVHGFTALSEGLALHWDQFDDKKRRALALQISDNARRVSNLLGHLLDLAKFNDGKMKLVLEEFNLIEVINNFIEEAKVLYIGEKNITINFSEVGRVIMKADSERVAQILRNIVVNAIKFSPKNGVINITLNENQLNEDRAIELIVSDHGIGIPEKELEAIFDPFVQSSKSTNKAGGTGLGLTIVKEITELHGGKIWAENNPERGASFHVILPVIEMTLAQKPQPKSDRIYKIMMIDDEEMCLTGTELFLTLNPEYQLIKFTDGQEAIDYLRTHRDVDLILLDMMMPDMDGTEVLAEIHKDEDLGKIPVLLQSGISDEREITKAQSFGDVSFIAKPYNSKQLIQKLQKMLGN